ncbi:MAG: hypothetical protein AB7P31_14335 [Steroidobacteraceae bacterium]
MPVDKRKPPASGARRVARIVHDDLGNARVEWMEIPDDRTGTFERPTFEIEGEEAADHAATYPYGHASQAGASDKRGGNTTRTDLRKLSEWIKLKREMEARKARGEDEEE